jgi:hypothetical protein
VHGKVQMIKRNSLLKSSKIFSMNKSKVLVRSLQLECSFNFLNYR